MYYSTTDSTEWIRMTKETERRVKEINLNVYLTDFDFNVKTAATVPPDKNEQQSASSLVGVEK